MSSVDEERDEEPDDEEEEDEEEKEEEEEGGEMTSRARRWWLCSPSVSSSLLCSSMDDSSASSGTSSLDSSSSLSLQEEAEEEKEEDECAELDVDASYSERDRREVRVDGVAEGGRVAGGGDESETERLFWRLREVSVSDRTLRPKKEEEVGGLEGGWGREQLTRREPG